MDNYATIERALQNRQNFKGNSLRAFWDGDTYRVISYNTTIATLEIGGERWVNPNKFSQTTTRQQNLIKRAWGLA